MAKAANRDVVFISYASGDRSFVDKILKNLRSRGLVGDRDEVVVPEKILVPGSSIREALREAIQSASKVIVIWSGESVGSQWVNYEIGMAEALGKPITVLVPMGEKRSLPNQLRDLQVVEVQHYG